MNRIQIILVGGSLVVHVGVWAWMGHLPKDKKKDAVAIALAESKKKTEPPKPEPPPPPPPPKEKPAARAKAAPAPTPEPVEAPPPPEAPPPSAGDSSPALDGFQDLGLAMAGGGGGGMALPTGPRGPARPANAPATHKVKTLAPAPEDACSDPIDKPKLTGQVQPAYTPEGRQASIEGVVKLEITIDATGRVTRVKVLRGLGYGLDEAAVAAAKQWTFKPAMRCGKPAPYVAKSSVRFQLGS